MNEIERISRKYFMILLLMILKVRGPSLESPFF
jgi:hypothetical protein